MELGITARTRPVRGGARADRAEYAVDVAEQRGRERRVAVAVPLEHVERLRAQLRREIDQIVRHAEIVARISRRLGRKRLRRRRLFTRHLGLRHGPFFDWPHRFAGHSIQHIQETLLAGRCDGFNRPAVDVDIDENRR